MLEIQTFISADIVNKDNFWLEVFPKEVEKGIACLRKLMEDKGLDSSIYSGDDLWI